MMGYPKGSNPLGSGFPIGASSIPVGTRFCLQSLVCYTFGDRGWLKGVVRGRNKHFQSATEQADSASSRTRSPGVCASRIRLFGRRWCGEMERQSAAEPRNGGASPGEPKGYHPPSRRSDVTLCSRHCIPLHTLSSRNLPRYPWRRMPSCSFCRASDWNRNSRIYWKPWRARTAPVPVPSCPAQKAEPVRGTDHGQDF